MRISKETRIRCIEHFHINMYTVGWNDMLDAHMLKLYGSMRNNFSLSMANEH